MTASDIKEATVDFIAKYYKEKGVAPSIRNICDVVPRLSNRKFYRLFKGGIAEACKLAGVSIPHDRIDLTSRAQVGKDMVRGSLEAGEVEELETWRKLKPFALGIMRSLGAPDILSALAQSKKLVDDFNPYALNQGIKTPAGFVKYHKEKEAEMNARVAAMERGYKEIDEMSEYELGIRMGLDSFTIAFWSYCYHQLGKKLSLTEFLNDMTLNYSKTKGCRMRIIREKRDDSHTVRIYIKNLDGSTDHVDYKFG